MNPSSETVAAEYQALAAKCRELATRTHRPEPLLSRAKTFEAAAAMLERKTEDRG